MRQFLNSNFTNGNQKVLVGHDGSPGGRRQAAAISDTLSSVENHLKLWSSLFRYARHRVIIFVIKQSNGSVYPLPIRLKGENIFGCCSGIVALLTS